MNGTMRAAVFRDRRGDKRVAPEREMSLSLVDKEIPQCIGAHDVVIRVLAAGLCQTDVHLIDGNAVAGVRPFDGMTLGHESGGVVVEVGPTVRSVSVGDFVLCYPFIPADESGAAGSRPPAEGKPRITPGISQDGGFAEYLLTDERCLVGVPDEATCRDFVALTDAGLAAFNAVERVVRHVSADSPVVIIGLGGLGHLGVQFALAMGLRRVFAIEPRDTVRLWASQLPIEAIFESVQGAAAELHRQGIQVGGVIDFVGSTDTADFAIEVLGFQGIYVATGVGGRLELPIAEVVERELTIQGAFVGTIEQLRNCIDLSLQANIRPLTRNYELTEVNQAISDLVGGRVLGRAVVNP